MTILRCLLLLLIFTISFSCHYSCQTCFGGNEFTHCTMCANNNTIKYINSITKDDNSLFKSIVPVGICAQPPIYPLNIYGIVVLCLGSLSYAVTQKSYSLQYLSTLQNMAFLGLLEIGFSNPSAYLWQGLRYLLIFTTTTSQTRTQNTQLTSLSKYNIQKYIKDTTYLLNLPLIITTNIFVGLLALNIFRKMFKCGQELPRNCQKIFEVVQRFAKLGFFYLIAENMWTIMMSWKYSSVSLSQYLLFGLYFLEVVLFVFYINWQLIKISVNDSKIRMYWQLIKKAVYPVLTIFNIAPIILPCVMIGFFIFQLIFQLTVLNKRHWKTYCYKTLEGITLVTFLVFVIGDVVIANWNFSEIFSWVIGLTLCLYSCIPIIEIISFQAKRCIINNIKAEIIHEVSNNLQFQHNPINTEISLPDDPNNPLENQRKVLHIPTVMSEQNITEEQQIGRSNNKGSGRNPSMFKSKLPVKSNSQASIFKSKNQLTRRQNEKSQNTKSHKLLVNEFIKQEVKQQNQVESQKQTIQVIKLDQIMRQGKAFSDKQTRQQRFLKNNLSQNRFLQRNMSQVQKNNSNQFELVDNTLNKREKRRINRKRKLMNQQEQEDEKKKQDDDI